MEEEKAPVMLLNVPAGHSVAMEEKGQKEPAAQGLQVVLSVAPGMLL